MLPYTPLHHLLLAAVGGPARADQRERVRRADRLPRRRRARAAGPHRRRVPDPRPADPHPHRRLGGARHSPGRPCCGGPAGYAPEPVRAPAAAPAAGAGLRRRAEEHVLPGQGRPRVHLATTSGTWRTPRRCARSPRASSTSRGCSTSSPPWSSPTTCTPSTSRPSTPLGAGRASTLVGVQHHHAHIASCLADNGEAGPVHRRRVRRHRLRPRRHHLGRRVPAWPTWPASSGSGTWRRCRCRAARPPSAQPWRMAAAYLARADGPGALAVLRGTRTSGRRSRPWRARGVNSPLTSSAGRLFDAVAALLGRPGHDQLRGSGRGRAGAAGRSCLNETPTARACPTANRSRWRGPTWSGPRPSDLARGVAPPVIAARFHHGVARLIDGGLCASSASGAALDTVALSGGVFQNLLLATRDRGPAGGARASGS